MVRAAAAAAVLALLAPPASAAPRQKEDAAAALNNPVRLVTIGDHARTASDFMLALSFYERALAIDPGFVPALRAATEVALAMRMPQAMHYAERWVSRQPQDGLSHLAFGAALVQQNRPTEAQKAFALAEAAGGPPAAIAVQRGLAYDLLGQSRNAQLAFAGAMQRAPGDRSILENMALSLAIGGDDAAALQLLQPEAERATGQASFERTLVLIHALAGRLDLARRIAESNLPPQAGAGIGDLLQRVSLLPTAAEKAAAVHLGILPDAGRVTVPPPVQTEVAEAPPAYLEAAPAPRSDDKPVEAAKAVSAVARPAATSSPAKPQPALPAGLPKLSAQALKAEHVWLQIASSPARSMLPNDHVRFRKKAGGVLNGYHAYVENAGTTHRLIVGPFRSMQDAVKVAQRLKARGVPTLARRIPAGATIAPL